MRCPKCKLVNPETALRCDCGFDFQSGQVEQSYLAPTPEPTDGEWISQRRVDELLGRGILFSLLWLMGIGSVLALLKGLEAKRLIARSDGRLTGTGAAWWCIVVGGVGMVIWIPLLLLGTFNVFR